MLAKIFSYYLKLQKMNTEHQPPHITFFGNSQTKVTGIARIGQSWHPLYVNYRVLLFAVSKKLDKVECFIQKLHSSRLFGANQLAYSCFGIEVGLFRAVIFHSSINR